MGIIKAQQMSYDYVQYNEEEEPVKSRAVDKIDLDIEAGSFIAVLGHNGSGKSTLAKHINALLLPSEGTIWIDGKDTSAETELWKIRKKAAPPWAA